MREHPHEYIIENTSIPELTHSVILRHSSEIIDTGKRGFFDVLPQSIELNAGLFINPSAAGFPEVAVSQLENSLVLSCACNVPKRKLCEHQVQVLYNIMDRQYLRIFFDTALRLEKIKQVAKEYGMENEPNPDDDFRVEYVQRSFGIKPKRTGLFPVNPTTDLYLKEILVPKENVFLFKPEKEQKNVKTIIVFGRHKHYDQLNIELLEVSAGKDGKIKLPFKSVDPSALIWKTEKIEETKFYTGISKFQNNYTKEKSESDLDGLLSIVKNPLQLDVFYHDPALSEKINPASLVPVKLKMLDADFKLFVDRVGLFYEVYGELVENEKSYALKTLSIRYDHFIKIGNTLHLIANPDLMRIIDFFKKNNPKILIHTSKYKEFRENILSRLEHKISIRYSYIKAATKKQIKEQGFDQGIEKIIYLSDHENYISITPVMKYGNIEVPVFFKKTAS